jgi:hypothetical protein
MKQNYPMAKTASSPSNPKQGTKRSANTSSSPVAKRGKTSGKGQKTIEESLTGIESDSEVAEQISENTSTNNQEEDLKAREAAVKKREDAVGEKEHTAHKGGKSKKNDNGLKDGEKNAFEEVKGDEDEVHMAAEKEQERNTVSDLSGTTTNLDVDIETLIGEDL